MEDEMANELSGMNAAMNKGMAPMTAIHLITRGPLGKNRVISRSVNQGIMNQSKEPKTPYIISGEMTLKLNTESGNGSSRRWMGASRNKNGMNTSPAVLDWDLM
jgi:hypothetical protein